MAAWSKVQSFSPQKTKINFLPSHFASLTTLTISAREASRLRDLKLNEFYLDLVRIYPGFDSMPEAAKIRLFDMIYNVGPS